MAFLESVRELKLLNNDKFQMEGEVGARGNRLGSICFSEADTVRQQKSHSLQIIHDLGKAKHDMVKHAQSTLWAGMTWGPCSLSIVSSPETPSPNSEEGGWELL